MTTLNKPVNVLNIPGRFLMPSCRKPARDSIVTFDSLIQFKVAKYIKSSFYT